MFMHDQKYSSLTHVHTHTHMHQMFSQQTTSASNMDSILVLLLMWKNVYRVWLVIHTLFLAKALGRLPRQSTFKSTR